MRFITKKTLPRRTVLRGLGAAVALPLLDAMVPPLTALARTPATPARRLGFVYIPNGVAMNAEVNHWKPAGEGTDFEFSSILTPLAPFRDHLTIVSGLSQPSAAEGANDGAHSRAAAGWLSGIGARQAQGENVRGGTTVDQVAADVLGRDTRLPSLELAIDSFSSSQVGNCDNGYDCVYLNTLAWRTPTTPLPMERHPAVVFERLFGEGGTAGRRQAEVRTDRSILDVVTGTSPPCSGRWGAATAPGWTSTSIRCAKSSAGCRSRSAPPSRSCRRSSGPLAFRSISPSTRS